MSLVEEEIGRKVVDEWVLEETEILLCVEIILLDFYRRLKFGEYHIMLVGKPFAGIYEAFPENLHCEVDSAAVCSTYEALLRVSRYGEGE